MRYQSVLSANVEYKNPKTLWVYSPVGIMLFKVRILKTPMLLSAISLNRHFPVDFSLSLLRFLR